MTYSLPVSVSNMSLLEAICKYDLQRYVYAFTVGLA